MAQSVGVASSSGGYAYRHGDGHRTTYMHREILGLERGDPRQGEHENRNPLDCRRSNLRIARRGQSDNKQNLGVSRNNTSGYRGVHWNAHAGKWEAQARLNGKKHYLGLFDTPEEADVAAKAFRAEHMPFSEDAGVLSSQGAGSARGERAGRYIFRPALNFDTWRHDAHACQ